MHPKGEAERIKICCPHISDLQVSLLAGQAFLMVSPGSSCVTRHMTGQVEVQLRAAILYFEAFILCVPLQRRMSL